MVYGVFCEQSSLFFYLANNLCVNWAAVIADFMIVIIVSTVIMMGVVITGRYRLLSVWGSLNFLNFNCYCTDGAAIFTEQIKFIVWVNYLCVVTKKNELIIICMLS